MLSEDKYFKTLTKDELWQRYCGFFDLSIDDFMDIQKELLMDQIEIVSDSTLGKKIMGNERPRTVEEFRRMVPLTTYADYEPYLTQQQEDVLVAKPYSWCHSAGRGGFFKWIPYSREFIQPLVRRMLTGCITATAKQRGQVNISPGLRFLVITPPAPYATGSLFKAFTELFSCQVIPPRETAEYMEFQERIQTGFQIALRDGVDAIAGIASVMAKMGEVLSSKTQGIKFSRFIAHPKVILRLLRAWLRAKREKRTILPKDLWPVKAIWTGGVDVVIYKDDISHYWGIEPYECYGCSESVLLALPDWNRRGMVFFPDLVFLEFIPYEEELRWQEDRDYKPTTVLLNEVEEGQSYEVVITHLYGMPLLRYRTRDLIRIVALRDAEAGVALPHVEFQSRLDETINLGGLVWLDEKMVWQAIANTGIQYADWSACKEYEGNQGFLRIYLELKEEREAAEIEDLIDEQLKGIEVTYRDIGSYLGLQPVRVTLLPPGTFQRYMDEKMQEGADLAHLKPSHMGAPEAAIRRLLQLSEVTRERP